MSEPEAHGEGCTADSATHIVTEAAATSTALVDPIATKGSSAGQTRSATLRPRTPIIHAPTQARQYRWTVERNRRGAITGRATREAIGSAQNTDAIVAGLGP